jgi:ribosomal protein S18 acetylase RimI-like enzyme
VTVMIRLGGRDDFPLAVEVWRAANTARLGRPVAPHHEARVWNYREADGAFLLVAEDDGALVGMALGMHGRADDGNGPVVPGLCHVSMVFVSPERWGSGIGGRLVDALLDEARAREYETAQLWTHADNERSQRLYERRGFRRSGRSMPDDVWDLIVHFERRL